LNRRICFIGTEITPSENSTFVGGHVNTIVGLCKGLTKLGWEIHIVTTPSRFFKHSELYVPWAKVHLLSVKGAYSSFKYNFNFLIKAIKVIENINRTDTLDLVHAHSGYFSLSIIPLIIKMRTGLPALFSLYCPASLLPKKILFDKYIINLLSTGLDKVIAVTSNVKNSLMMLGVKESKIKVVPLCIDKIFFSHSFYNDHRNEELNQTSDVFPIVLYMGNIDKAKGLDLFLDAAESLLLLDPRIKFIITLHESYEIIHSYNIDILRRFGSSVKILGVVNDVVGVMTKADVVVAPFRSTEGISDIPLIVLEAMALGKSVVASKLEGIEEVIRNGENGILVEPNNVDALVNALYTLLQDKKLRNKIGESASLSIVNFSNEEVSIKLNELYLDLLGSSDKT